MTIRIVSRTVLSLALAVSASIAAAQSDQATGRLPAGTVPDLGDRGNFLGLLELQRIIRGFQISPVPLNLQGKDLALVGLGSYIVNGQGGCNDCHTNPPYAEGGNPFLGQADKKPEIWSTGHRNIQAAAFDAQGRYWTVEHGARGGDELNLIEKGKNYGWPIQTFGIEYSGAHIGDLK